MLLVMMQCTADPVMVRGQRLEPRSMKETVLGTIACSIPEVFMQSCAETHS